MIFLLKWLSPSRLPHWNVNKLSNFTFHFHLLHFQSNATQCRYQQMGIILGDQIDYIYALSNITWYRPSNLALLCLYVLLFTNKENKERRMLMADIRWENENIFISNRNLLKKSKWQSNTKEIVVQSFNLKPTLKKGKLIQQIWHE